MLRGRSALIVGATSDIGSAISKAFVNNGVSKLFIQGRSNTKLTELRSSIRSNSDHIVIAPVDITSQSGVDSLYNIITSDPQLKIDIFVFCPGTCGEMDPVTFIRVESDFQNVFQINFLSLVSTFSKISRVMSADSSAIFISSTNSFTPLECGSAYCSTKASMKAYMKSVALELGTRNIRVNTINPGLVETKFHKPYFDSNEELGSFFEKKASSNPLGRNASVESVANAALFLGSNLSCCITGTELVVDCGESLVATEHDDEDEEED